MTALSILLGIIMILALMYAVAKLCEITGQIFQPRRTPDRFPVRFWKE